MDQQHIPARSEVPEEFTWDLSCLFENDEAWFSEYEALRELPERLNAYRGRLGESAETLLEYFRLQDEISVRISAFFGYAVSRADEDSGNGKYQDMRGKAIAVWTAISAAGAFAGPEICALDEDRLNLFRIAQPGLEEYERSLCLIRRMKAHILSPAEEKLLAAFGGVSDGPDNIGNMLRDSDLRYPPVRDAEGKEHVLSDGSLVPLLESADRVLRENTFRSYYARLGEFQNTAAAILDLQFRQLLFLSRARRYDTTLEAALDGNEVPVGVYANLIEAVHGNLDKLHRYVALRKRLLGVDELHMYDIYTPIVPDAAVKIPFEQARETVLEALGVLGEDYTALLREGFENRWIDVYENQGKRSGAYCTNHARPHPHVLLNYKDTLDNMFTLAHEMGHALHSTYSARTQPVSTADYVIFVAEVASTCNEILLMRHLLGKTEDVRQRAALINHFLDQFKGTVYRQTMFAEFERMLGEMCERGETLIPEVLNEKYLALNRLYYGPEMVSDGEIAVEWARIPHFFYNYYVFQYATGFSAAAAIARRILDEGASAVADYKRFLSGGCSRDPISLLKIAGVDMSSPEPVNAALSLFGELISEMERLADRL